MIRIAVVAVLLVCLMLAVPCQAVAEETVSTVSDHEVEFPDSLTFTLTAKDQANGTIEETLLQYRIEGVTDLKVTTMVPVAVEEGSEVVASWRWDMRKAPLPPGAEVSYRWVIENSAGGVVETDWQTVSFEDNRHSWDSVGVGNVTLFWYRGGQAFSRELIDAAAESLERLGEDSGSYLREPVEVYIYDGSKALREALIHQPEWVGGVAFTHFGIIAIGIAPEDLAWGKRVMTHELAHLVTYQMTSNPYNDIPTWLNEGISVYAEGEVDPLFKMVFEDAVSDDALISLRTLSSSFPAAADQARLSYAESRAVFEFLVDSYGTGNMTELLGVFKEGASYDGALEKVYGFDTDGLDDLWRASLGLDPRPTETLAANGTNTTPTESPGNGLVGCGAGPTTSGHWEVAPFALLGLVLMPCLGEVLRLRIGRRGSGR